MFTGFLHTHKLAVVLFLLLYLLKTILLLTNQTEMLEKVKTKTKVPEMIISTLFLVTGLYLVFNTALFSKFLVMKLVAVLFSIPIAIIGFKKNNKIMASLAMILIILAYGFAEMNKKAFLPTVEPDYTVMGTTSSNEIADPLVYGQQIYSSYCVTCHGADGKLGLSGAKDLSTSTLTEEEVGLLLVEGKNSMPKFSEALDQNQLMAVKKYTLSLRK